MHRPIGLAQMGKHAPMVMVAIEDQRFWTHSGIDCGALCAAIFRNLKYRKTVSGASTISQQVIKLESGRLTPSIGAKLYEILAATKLERKWSKTRILERCLNQISFSNRLIGIEAAASVYFGKTADKLSLEEAIFLCGLPQSPTRLNPWRRPSKADKRFDITVERLRKRGFLDSSINLTAPKVYHFLPKNYCHHFVNVIKARHQSAGGRVQTSINLELQQFSSVAVKDVLNEIRSFNVTQAAVVIMENHTGLIRAMVGSADFYGKEGQINGSLIRRGAGSTLKPFIYAMALEDRRMTPATLIPDTPDAIQRIYPDYSPRNFDSRFWGPVRVREALACSMNVPAVQVIHTVGARSAYQKLNQMGFDLRSPFEHYGAGLALGNAEIRLIDLVEAFSIFPRNGSHIQARFRSAEPQYTQRHFSSETAALLVDILSDNYARARTFGSNSPLAFDVKIPCKTGTSSSFRDNWTVGATKQHTVGVWMGNFNGSTSDNVSSVNGAARVFRSIILELLERGDNALDSNSLNSNSLKR